jgi:hypothetical protein
LRELTARTETLSRHTSTPFSLPWYSFLWATHLHTSRWGGVMHTHTLKGP